MIDTIEHLVLLMLERKQIPAEYAALRSAHNFQINQTIRKLERMYDF